MCLDATQVPATLLDELKDLLSRFPGESEVVLEMRTSAGGRRLRLGTGFRVKADTALRAELHELLGDAALAA